MRRRAYLAAVSGGALGFAGCSGDVGERSGDEPTDVIETLAPTRSAPAATVETTGPETGTRDGSAVATDATGSVGDTDTAGAGTASSVDITDDTELGGDTTPSEGRFGPVTITDDERRGGTLGLTKGPITAAFEHEGRSNFIVKLVAVAGGGAETVTLANAIGAVDGAQVSRIGAAGPYRLDVTAEGDWEIALDQPAGLESTALPIDADGEGLGYVGPYAFDGSTTFVGSHDGSGPFVVTPVAVGSRPTTTAVFNELGSFAGETTVALDSPAYLNVRATGGWALSTES